MSSPQAAKVTNARPQLCFGQVRHARLRPKNHAFGYKVFFLRLPLRAMADADTGLRIVSRNRFNLLSFHDRDHGDGRRPLVAWIDDVLKQEGIADADGEIWLQAFPRVLGYVFNPVSFWFCHRSDGALRAVLCEVNNTFGERHCYLLESSVGIGNGHELTAIKVFHVSPFCQVKGRYRFRFLSRVQADSSVQSVARIDYEDEAGPLLNTSVSGTSQPLTDAAAARAFVTHPMMTIGVMLKIHWQALQLWLRRIPFHVKPAPPAEEITR